MHELLALWQRESLLIGMCFVTTASKMGRVNGACTALHTLRGLQWTSIAMGGLPALYVEVLLSEAFGGRFGPSTGPEILIFKRFRDKWSVLANHTPIGKRLSS